MSFSSSTSSSSSASSSPSSTRISTDLPIQQPINQEKKTRVSVTFRVGKGKESKSRDFPGKYYGAVDGKLIQIWAKDFRCGTFLFNMDHTPSSNDQRTVTLPHTNGGRRRKPWVGASVLNKSDCFYWFRSMQSTLMNTQEKKKVHVVEPPAEQQAGSSSSLKSSKKLAKPQGSFSFSSFSSPPFPHAALSQLSALPIQQFIPSVYNEASSNHSNFIECHYTPSVSEQMKQLLMVLG